MNVQPQGGTPQGRLQTAHSRMVQERDSPLLCGCSRQAAVRLRSSYQVNQAARAASQPHQPGPAHPCPPCQRQRLHARPHGLCEALDQLLSVGGVDGSQAVGLQGGGAGTGCIRNHTGTESNRVSRADGSKAMGLLRHTEGVGMGVVAVPNRGMQQLAGS